MRHEPVRLPSQTASIARSVFSISPPIRRGDGIVNPSQDRDIRLKTDTNGGISRRHAELVPSSGAWILKDLGSSNGTYVNGSRVENTYALKLGDQIRVEVRPNGPEQGAILCDEGGEVAGPVTGKPRGRDVDGRVLLLGKASGSALPGCAEQIPDNSVAP